MGRQTDSSPHRPVRIPTWAIDEMSGPAPMPKRVGVDYAELLLDAADLLMSGDATDEERIAMALELYEALGEVDYDEADPDE